MALASVVCWRMWWTKNEVVHGSDGGVGEDIVEWASNFLAAYRSAQLPRALQPGAPCDSWQAQGAGQVKVNFDVDYVAESHYQIAVVARSEEGTCLWWRVRRLTGQPPAVVGEARAALEGVMLAMERGGFGRGLLANNLGHSE